MDFHSNITEERLGTLIDFSFIEKVNFFSRNTVPINELISIQILTGPLVSNLGCYQRMQTNFAVTTKIK